MPSVLSTVRPQWSPGKALSPTCDMSWRHCDQLAASAALLCFSRNGIISVNVWLMLKHFVHFAERAQWTFDFDFHCELYLWCSTRYIRCFLILLYLCVLGWRHIRLNVVQTCNEHDHKGHKLWYFSYWNVIGWCSRLLHLTAVSFMVQCNGSWINDTKIKYRNHRCSTTFNTLSRQQICKKWNANKTFIICC